MAFATAPLGLHAVSTIAQSVTVQCSFSVMTGIVFVPHVMSRTPVTAPSNVAPPSCTVSQ